MPFVVQGKILSQVHTGSMGKLCLLRGLDMQTDVFERPVKMIFVRCVVGFVVDACRLWYPAGNMKS